MTPRSIPRLLAALIAVSAGPLPAAVFKTAEVTRILNDVRVVQETGSAAPAAVGNVIRGKIGVATGASSRAELKFPDRTLTRLGSNTMFRLEEGTRDIELEEGVILLQVPKQLGGARVKTAAVTAAVTGTTIMCEFQPNGFIKIIVLEGSVDLFLNDSPGTFRTLNAGDMIIMKPDADSIPMPVQIDLERLMATSGLLDPEFFDPLGNLDELDDALEEQEEKKNDGELIKTAFVVPGRGTRVTFSNEVRNEILTSIGIRRPSVPGVQVTPPTGPGGPGAPSPGPGPDGGPLPGIPLILGNTIINAGDPIVTNPFMVATNDAGGAPERRRLEGGFYVPAVDGPINDFFFDEAGRMHPFSKDVLEAGVWAAFHFDSITVQGDPSIDSNTGSRNLLFAANDRIQFTFPYEGEGNGEGDSELTVTTLPPSLAGSLSLDPSLDRLFLATDTGDIDADSFSINGSNQQLFLQAGGPTSDISLEFSTFNIPGGRFSSYSGQDTELSFTTVTADTVSMQAGRNLEISSYNEIDAQKSISLVAEQSITISNSSQLRVLANMDLQGVTALAKGGDLSVLDSMIAGNNQIDLQSEAGSVFLSNATLTADVIKARTLAPNGTLQIGGGSLNAAALMNLYAGGSNGRVLFDANTTLNSPTINIAGKSVRVAEGVEVNVPQTGGFRVFSDAHEYSNGNMESGFGYFITNGEPFPVNQGSFNGRPPY